MKCIDSIYRMGIKRARLWGKGVLEVLEVGEAEGGAEAFAKIEPVLLGNGQEDIDHGGSNCVPEQWRISARASDLRNALRHLYRWIRSPSWLACWWTPRHSHGFPVTVPASWVW